MTDFKFLKHEGAPDNCACCFIDINSSECTRQHYRCGLGLHGYFAPATNKGNPEMTEKIPTQPQPANTIQYGGSHYKDAPIQPWDVIDTWPIEQQIGFYRGNGLKYNMRFGSKDEELLEAKKSLHYLQKLVEVLEKRNAPVL
jgi:hypothetical protein